MRRALILVLTLLAALTTGSVAVMATHQCYYQAALILEGKPLPALTEWAFQLSDGVLLLFLIPWALFLSDTVWSAHRPCQPVEKHVEFLLGFLLFVVLETLVAAWLAIACSLPFLSVYGVLGAPQSRTGTYILTAVFCLLLTGAFALAISLFAKKRKLKQTK